ncbi:MAG: TerB family tellurite resistance protein [Flavobacteriales bacterium]|jgi:uncharacterized tellurite resistance protein B-like protein|nr:TerB family tellurite resistance protein [Flavobacteriales bacterium]
MSIYELYSSGAHKRNLGHFANIVALAVADNVITEDEQILLIRMKKRLGIKDSEYREILENPKKYPINPPVDYDGRIERLYNLTRMIVADSDISDKQVSMLHRIVIGLGFPIEREEKIVEAAFFLVEKHLELDDFIDAIKKVK